MKHFVTNESFSSYVCEICSAELAMRNRTKPNKIKIKGIEVQVSNQSVFNILKREYGHEANEQ